MYQAESLIAPKALLAKLLPWNVTPLRYPPVRRKPRFSLSIHPLSLSRPPSLPRARSRTIQQPSLRRFYVIDSVSSPLPQPWNHFDATGRTYTIARAHQHIESSNCERNGVSLYRKILSPSVSRYEIRCYCTLFLGPSSFVTIGSLLSDG